LGDGALLGVKIRYGNEGKTLLDTAGAVRNALPLLADRFFITFGDSYLKLPYRRIWEDYHRSSLESLMVVFRNDNRYDTSDISVADGLVTAYRKYPPLLGANYINHGLMILRRDSVASIAAGTRISLQQFLQPIIVRGQMMAWETTDRFYEIGSVTGLKELEDLIAANEVSS